MNINVKFQYSNFSFTYFVHVKGLVYHTLGLLANRLMAMSRNRLLQVDNASENTADVSGIFAEVMLGRRFFSWEEFENSLGEFQKLSCTHYVRIQSKTIGEDRFKYAHVAFKCTFGVNRTRAGPKLRNKSSKCCNCPSAFRVILHFSEYVITSHKMVHNHPCTRVYMRNDPWCRRLTAEEKENLEPLLHQSHSSDEIMKYVKETFHKDITRTDVKNLKASVNKGNVDVIVNYFRYVES
ncbi:unnamed protein product [Trichobilharzia szidati]|nr:unnamed protein product [Trichobilharzia szidati]